MTDDDNWTGRWVGRKLFEGANVTFSLLSPKVLRIRRQHLADVIVATMAVSKVTDTEVQAVLAETSAVSFIANVKSGAVITPRACRLARRHDIAVGGLSDLITAINLPHPGEYVSSDVAFTKRILNQHTRVTEVHLLDDRRLKASRSGLSAVIILALNHYEFSAEKIRDAIEKYGHFHAIFGTNPNCRASRNAKMVSSMRGIRLFTSASDLMGELNKEWKMI